MASRIELYTSESDSEIEIEEDGGLENITNQRKQNRKKWVHISTFQSKEDTLTREKYSNVLGSHA